MNALRSRLNDIARRNSGLLNGGLSRLMIKWRLTFPGVCSQIAPGTWLSISFIIGGDSALTRSSLPEMNARTVVAGSRMTVNSMPSR